MVKLVLTGIWVCAITLASVYFSVRMATAPAPDPDAAKQAQQEYVKGEVVNVPIIGNEAVSGYFITKISYMMNKDRPKTVQDLPLTELTTDELYSLLVGNKMIDLSHAKDFDLPAFRDQIKKSMNERFGGDYVASVLVEQLDYLSKDEIRANEGAPVKKNLKPMKIVEGDVPPMEAVEKAH
jgi:hypothetical protein